MPSRSPSRNGPGSTIRSVAVPGPRPPTCVTVNYAPDTGQRVTAVLNALAQEVDAQFRRVADAAGQSAEAYAATLLTDRGQITGPARRLVFTYPFDRTVHLKRQRLTFKTPPRTAGTKRAVPILRSHHLTVTVTLPDDVVAQVRDSLRDYIALICPDDEDSVALVEMLDRMVEEPGSDLHRLIRIITTETLGQINKRACRRYLGYLADRMSAETAKTIDAQPYVRDLIHRLEAIETYIHDNRPDDAYQFSYRGDEYDWHSILSGATLYEELPLVAQVGESLGETMDDRHGQEQTFSYGLRLKLNGPALAVGDASAFAYRNNTDGVLLVGLCEAARLDTVVLVDAEHEEIATYLTARLLDQGHGRPP